MPLFKPKTDSPKKKSSYRIANYCGSSAARPKTEASGILRFSADGYWELRFEPPAKALRGQLRQLPLVVTPTGPSSSSVTICHALDGSKILSFELPDTSASELEADLATRPNAPWTQEDEDEVQRKKIDDKFSITLPAIYLGGLPQRPQRSTERLTLAFRAAGMFYESSYQQPRRICSWDVVQCVDIGGGEVAKTKIAATIMFGAVGGLAAKGAKGRTYISVKLKDGSEGIWQVDKKAPMEVRASLAPLLHEVGVPFAGELAAPVEPLLNEAPAPAPLVADELLKLGDLRDKGLLTDEEFNAQKARLLAQ